MQIQEYKKKVLKDLEKSHSYKSFINFLEFPRTQKEKELYEKRINRSNLTKEHIDKLYTIKERLKNVNYDIKNAFEKYSFKEKNESPKKEKNETRYKYIRKNTHYFQYNLYSILKMLLSSHAINTYQYKKTIKRIKQKKDIPNKVKEKINSLLKEIAKANTTKTNITAIKRKAQRNREIRIYHKHNKQKYTILLKRQYALTSQKKTQKYTDNRQETIKEAIKEFKHKIKKDNIFLVKPQINYIPLFKLFYPYR